VAVAKKLRAAWKQAKSIVDKRIAGSGRGADYLTGMNPGDARKVKAALKNFRITFAAMLDKLEDAYDDKDDRQTRVSARQGLQLCQKYRQATKAASENKSDADDPMRDQLRGMSRTLGLLVKSGIKAKVQF